LSEAGAALAQDARARREALDTSRSMLLQAPAGSGKTTVLTARFLALLAVVDSPEEILAVTFTRKAAAEMRHRVIAALQCASSGTAVTGIPDELLTAAARRNLARGWDLLKSPTRLRIETLDALNYWLASQLPIAARASPGLQIASDPRPLYRRAARRCLESAHTDEQIAAAADLVFERLDNNWGNVESRLAQMLQQRSHWLPRVVGSSAAELLARIEGSLCSSLSAELAAASALIPAALLRQGEQILTHSLRTRALAVPAGGVHLNADPSSVPCWRELARLALVDKGRAWRRGFNITDGFAREDRLMKATARDWCDAMAATQGALAALNAVAELPDPVLGAGDRQALEALSRLLLRAAEELQVEFANSAMVDFSYVSGAAREALIEQSDPTDLALRIGTAIRHILVDEFQDTSQEQLALLQALTAGWSPGDGRTLFVVGDPMQSIYQFREAEVGLFLQARDHGVGEIRLEGLQLRQNFRSRAAVIDWINDRFARLFPPTDNARLAAIRYLASTPGPNPIAPIAYDGPAVQLHAFEERDFAAEAERVVQVIQQARTHSPQASIAVLVAARLHAAILVAKLAAGGLEVRGIELEPLNERTVVRDLSSLTRALLHGADYSAWLALLHAPWCGLTLAELESLDLAAHGDLFAVLTASPQGLAPEPGERLRRLCEALRPAIEGGERGLPLSQRLERCWLRLGGPAIFCSEAQRLDARRFIDLLAQHDEAESLVGETLSQIVKDLYASSPPRPGAIDVMTMHAAKGLEWDIVILPGLGRRMAPTIDRLLHWIELPRSGLGTDLLLAPIRATDKEIPGSLAAYIKRLRRNRIALERVRLLYVATTRARKALHLLGGLVLPKSGGPPEAYRYSLLWTLWRAIGEDFLARYRLEMAAPQLPAVAPTISPALLRLPAHWKIAQPPAAPPTRRFGAGSPVPQTAPEYRWVGLTARAVGTIVHAQLRRLAEGGSDAAARDDDARDYDAWLSELGVDRSEFASASARIRDALRRTLDDPRGRWLLSGKHREAHSEWRLTGIHEGRLINVIFDRMLVDEQGQRWVIDYKTSTHEGGAVQEFIDREADRYRAQMQRYATLASQIDGGIVKVALYFPLLGVFRELALASKRAGE
jgi:ATP-dependent helicase/nuclease subunit A